jgi:hypothetical protein
MPEQINEEQTYSMAYITSAFRALAQLEKRIEQLELEQQKHELFKKWIKGMINGLKNIGKEKF